MSLWGENIALDKPNTNLNKKGYSNKEIKEKHPRKKKCLK